MEEGLGSGVSRRKEKRKALKKVKRKQKRREIAEKNKEHEEALLNDPDEQQRILLDEERETERLLRDRSLFEERERLFLLHLDLKNKQLQQQEEDAQLLLNQVPHEDEDEDEDGSDWEYVEDGPPKIIWQGNEIIVQKTKVKVKRKDADQPLKIEGPSRPTSNPFPPESEPSVDCKNVSVLSSQQILDNTAQQIPNFGTEQDKAHCPFQIKTGACRFGLRCSRLHFYPEKSCTLLIKNMYNGPGLAFEQDEGLEHTDEEVDSFFEEFYEDVHTEFLKFGEIVNFKVCRNSSLHLRGNLYVHYKSEDSAMLAYQTVNGRYFAGKQVTCEFVGVTKWRVAICGEFMRSRLKTCSRGTACNFIHCFRNPGGDYEWADWDKPPPKYWTQEMAALFGHSQHSSDRSPLKRSLSREWKSYSHRHEDYDFRRRRCRKTSSNRSAKELEHHQSGYGVYDSDSDRDHSNGERGQDRHHDNTRRRSISVLDNQDYYDSKTCRTDSDSYSSKINKEKDRKRKRDQDSHRKRGEDMHHRPNGKRSTPKRERSDIWDVTHSSEFRVEDKGTKRYEDISPYGESRDKCDNINNSKSMLKDKDRKKDEDVQYHRKGKSSTPKLKSRGNWDSADDKEFMAEDKSGIQDEDIYCKLKRKGSTSKRKSRDKYWGSTNDSKLMVERDESKSRQHSRKSSRHSNEERDLRPDVERRGRWDDKVGVENCNTCRVESNGFQDQNSDVDLSSSRLSS